MQIRSRPYSYNGYHMGTMVMMDVYGINAEPTANIAIKEIERLESLWSVFKPDSEVSMLARHAGEQSIEVSSDTLKLLSLAKHYHEITSGAFDITIAPLMDKWRESAEESCLPSENDIESLRSLVDSKSIILSGNAAYLGRNGQSIDMGGIGKGYAADSCAHLYKSNGIKSAMLNMGGNVIVVGAKPDGEPWCVGIQAPMSKRGECMGYIEAIDCSVVTSANYERYFEVGGRRYSHIISPLTGRTIPFDAMSVTIVSSSSARADALATACMVFGVEKARELIEKLDDAEMLLLDKHGEAHQTKGLEKHFVRI